VHATHAPSAAAAHATHVCPAAQARTGEQAAQAPASVELRKVPAGQAVQPAAGATEEEALGWWNPGRQRQSSGPVAASRDVALPGQRAHADAPAALE
jgi:hypothetical protein